jgi:hypothetical protein
MILIVLKNIIEYLSVKSTLMKKEFSSEKPALIPLHNKFKDAGCECALKKDKHQTTLIIRYAAVVNMHQSTRPTA